MPPRTKSFFPREREAERRVERAQAVEDLVATRLAPRATVSQDLPRERIRPNPYQARRAFTDLDELAEAIRQQGFISRLRVRPDPTEAGYYQLVYGERRLRAAEQAGLVSIPCDVAEHSDRELIEIGLVENIQRQDLNPLEEAHALQTFIRELDYSIRSLAERLGKHRSYVEGRLALLRAPEDVQELVMNRPDTLDAARQIASVADPQERAVLISGVASGELTSQTVRERVSEQRDRQKGKSARLRERDHTPLQAADPRTSAALQVSQDVTVITSVLAAWEHMITEQPEQIAAIQAGLTTILTRSQTLLDLMEQRVKERTTDLAPSQS
jgi:ParB family transcriptional regulator, chromosome partitioning protein